MNRDIYTETSNRNRNNADLFIVRNHILLNTALKVVSLNKELKNIIKSEFMFSKRSKGKWFNSIVYAPHKKS